MDESELHAQAAFDRAQATERARLAELGRLRAVVFRLRTMVACGGGAEFDDVDREIVALGMRFVEAKPLLRAISGEEISAPTYCPKCGEYTHHPVGCHNHEGNCAWCPRCFDRGDDFFVGECADELCHKHQQPRGECADCPPCPACDASGEPLKDVKGPE